MPAHGTCVLDVLLTMYVSACFVHAPSGPVCRAGWCVPHAPSPRDGHGRRLHGRTRLLPQSVSAPWWCVAPAARGLGQRPRLPRHPRSMSGGDGDSSLTTGLGHTASRTSLQQLSLWTRISSSPHSMGSRHLQRPLLCMPRLDYSGVPYLSYRT